MRSWSCDYSLVRVLNAMSKGEAVDVYINNTPFFRGLNLTEFSPYSYGLKGEYEIIVYIAGTIENQIARSTISVESQELITVAILGDEDEVELLPIRENTQAPSGNNSKMRVAQLSPNALEFNVLVDNEPLFTNVKFRDITEYIEIPSNIYRIDIEAVMNGRILRSIRAAINPNRIYTLYFVGNPPNVAIIQSLDGSTFLN